MANIPSAKKRARQAEKRRQRNASYSSMMRTYLKRVVYAIAAGEKDKAAEALKIAAPLLDKAASKGLIHKNKAARHKSRLNAKIQALA